MKTSIAIGFAFALVAFAAIMPTTTAAGACDRPTNEPGMEVDFNCYTDAYSWVCVAWVTVEYEGGAGVCVGHDLIMQVQDYVDCVTHPVRCQDDDGPVGTVFQVYYTMVFPRVWEGVDTIVCIGEAPFPFPPPAGAAIDCVTGA